MIKYLITYFLFFTGVILNAQTIDLVWHNNVEKALKKATKENKQTLVYFSGSDWCKPCMELKEEVFNTKLFKEKAQKDYILVNIDFPRNQKQLSKEQVSYIEQTAEKYNRLGAFPLVLILDNKGKISTSIDGYKSETASYYINNYLNK